MKSSSIKLLAALACAASIGGAAHAATLGTDDATATAYNDGWGSGDDGFITGDAAFGAWTLTSTGGDAGQFIGDSTAGGGDVNVSGESFGMFGHSGQTSEAFRSFDSGLTTGQTFSLDLSVNFRNGNKGLDLRDSSNTVIFNFNIGGDNYVVNNATTGNGSIGNTYSSNSVFNLSFTQTSGSGGTWTITRSGGVSDLDSGTYTGVPTNFKLYNSGTDNAAAANNLYANNLSIVPEPSTVGLLLLSGTGMLALFRRRNA